MPTADLKVTKVYNDSSCDLWALITNAGKSAIATDVADAYWINGKLNGTGQVSLNLAPGQSTKHSFNKTMPMNYDTANIKYQLDTKNAVTEMNENDNEATATLTCKIVQLRDPRPPPARPSTSNRAAPAAPVQPEPEQPPAGRLKLPSR